MVFRWATERRGRAADLLVVGLGNPEANFAGTRHNLGADVVTLVAERAGVRLGRSRERAMTAEARFGEKLVVLAVPTTFMNLSGEAVRRLARRHGITEPGAIVVVHDELDLPVGRLKIKVGGGIAGHNGLRSIRQHLGSADFVRVRLGIGKPPGRQSGSDFVLRRPSVRERTELEVVVERAADAVESIIGDGAEAAMSVYNARQE